MPPLVNEPLKLISPGLGLLLLAPFGIVFWRIAVHRPWLAQERRTQRQAALDVRADMVGTVGEDGSVIAEIAIVSDEIMGFSERAMAWLSFYPSTWAGIVGRVSVVTNVVRVMISLFVPQGELLTCPPG